MQIVLLGARGSGKTTVGRLLAARLAIEWIDTDALVVARAGTSISAIFAEHGEAHFRDVEQAVVDDVMRWTGDRVISLGGGSLLRESTRELLLRSCALRYYLRASPQTLYERVWADPHSRETRPALTALTGIVEAAHLIEVREPLYRAVMTRELNADRFTPDALVSIIVGELDTDSEKRLPL